MGGKVFWVPRHDFRRFSPDPNPFKCRKMESQAAAAAGANASPAAGGGGASPAERGPSRAANQAGASSAGSGPRAAKCIACQNAGVSCSRTTPVGRGLVPPAPRKVEKVDLGGRSTHFLVSVSPEAGLPARRLYLTRFSHLSPSTVHQVRDRGRSGGTGGSRWVLPGGWLLQGGPDGGGRGPTWCLDASRDPSQAPEGVGRRWADA